MVKHEMETESLKLNVMNEIIEKANKYLITRMVKKYNQ